jgi:hypothetical protein
MECPRDKARKRRLQYREQFYHVINRGESPRNDFQGRRGLSSEFVTIQVNRECTRIHANEPDCRGLNVPVLAPIRVHLRPFAVPPPEQLREFPRPGAQRLSQRGGKGPP